MGNRELSNGKRLDIIDATNVINDHSIGTSSDWKPRISSMDVYRVSENLFEVTSTVGSWITAMVSKDTLLKLYMGELDYLDLDWE